MNPKHIALLLIVSLCLIGSVIVEAAMDQPTMQDATRPTEGASTEPSNAEEDLATLTVDTTLYDKNGNTKVKHEFTLCVRKDEGQDCGEDDEVSYSIKFGENTVVLKKAASGGQWQASVSGHSPDAGSGTWSPSQTHDGTNVCCITFVIEEDYMGTANGETPSEKKKSVQLGVTSHGAASPEQDNNPADDDKMPAPPTKVYYKWKVPPEEE